MRRKITVSIYERVKHGAKWRRKRVAIPPCKANGTLFFKDDRQGIFQLSWHENDRNNGRASKAVPAKIDLRFSPMPLRRPMTNPGS